MQVYIVQDYGQLAELQSQWDTLASLRQIPLLGHAWFYSCARALHDETDLYVVALMNEHNEALAIAPLARSGRSLVALGTSQLFEPSGFLYRDTQSLGLLYGQIQRQKRPVVIQRYWGSEKAQELPDHPSIANGYWLKQPSNGSGVLAIDRSRSDFLASLSSRRRYDLKRAQRRAGSLGGERFQSLRPSKDTLDDAFELACDIEEKSWKGKQGSSISMRGRLRTFLQLYLQASLDTGTCRFFFLYIGNTAAAMAICIQTQEALWFLKIGYDEQFKACSPGLLLLSEIYQYAYEEGLSRMEHLGHHEAWLSPWTTYVRPYSTLVHYPANFRGLSALSRHALHFGASRAYHTVKRWQNSR
jgi:CelD/BcsL family acetyltransferase involved in cellulose biosynthesis